MTRYLAAFATATLIAASAALSSMTFAADAPAKPAAMPPCCGDTCKKMGASCCKADDKGKVTCSMGGSCCMKPSTAPAAAK